MQKGINIVGLLIELEKRQEITTQIKDDKKSPRPFKGRDKTEREINFCQHRFV